MSRSSNMRRLNLGRMPDLPGRCILHPSTDRSSIASCSSRNCRSGCMRMLRLYNNWCSIESFRCMSCQWACMRTRCRSGSPSSIGTNCRRTAHCQSNRRTDSRSCISQSSSSHLWSRTRQERCTHMPHWSKCLSSIQKCCCMPRPRHSTRRIGDHGNDQSST